MVRNCVMGQWVSRLTMRVIICILQHKITTFFSILQKNEGKNAFFFKNICVYQLFYVILQCKIEKYEYNYCC